MKHYVIKHYEIHSEKLNSLKQPIRIIFISDFHNARFGSEWKRLAADLKSLHADLILSGHYHGGIVRLGGKYPVVGNDFTLFPKYAYGYYEKEQSVMLVSAGLGEHTIPLRLWNPRELVVADIKGKR